MESEIKIISKTNILPSVWDGGKTFEYFIFPEDSVYDNRNFLFRISSASIDKTPSDFTKFKGYKRYLVMIGDELSIIRNGEKENYSDLEIFEFNSDDEITSFSLGNDFNLMVSEKIKFSKLLLTDSFREINNEYIFIHAIEKSKIILNENGFELEKSDLLIYKNPERKLIKLKSDNRVIVALIDVG